MLHWLPALVRMNSVLASVFASRNGFSHYGHCRYKSLRQRPKFCLHPRLLNVDELTTEVQQQWLIKQRLNLDVSSRFNDAHNRIDLWLVNYCRFHYPAERTRPTLYLLTQQPELGSEILALPWLIRYSYSYRLNWQSFNNTNRGGGGDDVLRLTCLSLSSLMSLRFSSSREVDSCFTHTILL